jgi:hypothetical protein
VQEQLFATRGLLASNRSIYFHWKRTDVMIQVQVDVERGVTLLNASGQLEANAVMSALAAAYVEGPTRSFLVDVRKAAEISIEVMDLQSIIRITSGHSVTRGGGRSALVSGAGPNYGYCRAIETMVRSANSPVEVRAFRDMDSALAWLGIGPEDRPGNEDAVLP